MRTQRTNLFSLLALVAACSLGLCSDNLAAGGQCGCEAVCLDCPPNQCDCACECAGRKVHNPVYKVLDSVAGGIEKLLCIDKLNCCSANCCSGGRTGACDDLSCDDGCDGATLEAFSLSESDVHFHQSQPPGVMPAPGYDSHVSPATPDQWQGDQMQNEQWQAEPQSPKMEMRMGEPQVIEPELEFQQTLPNPFEDDARVNHKRRVRAAAHEQMEHRVDPRRPGTQHPKRKHSRGYNPWQLLLRTVR